MKLYRLLLAAIITAVVLSGCSVVFTSSITGSIVDEEQYDNGTTGSGIADAEVYLYTETAMCSADLTAWTADNSVLPDEPAAGEPTYFLKTITDEQGAYTFNGLIWNELFPEYGKSGDRKEVFMLFHHERYGLQEAPYPVYVVSDVTNRIPLFKLPRILNTARIAGTVRDGKTDQVLPNANVLIWVPKSWEYTAVGNIDTSESKFTWETDPSYTALSDVNGEWEQEISYKMLPSSTDNNETTIIRLTYLANGYIAENATDSKIIDGGWDRDGNGSIDPDEDDGYYQSGEITDDTYADLGEIALADEYNAATLTGTVLNSSSSTGEQNVRVDIYVAEDWSYNSSDPDDIQAATAVDWPENPSYSTTTDADGEYTQTIRFERKPSQNDNRGTTRVRVVFTKDTFKIDSTTDVKLTDGGWDRDENGTIDVDEDDAFYDPSSVITKDRTNDLGSIKIKQTKFNETLSGEVVNVGGTGIDGVVVWLFFTPDHDGNPATPHQDTLIPVVGTTIPTKKTSTQLQIITQDQVKLGRFNFPGLEWEDTTYTSDQSDIGYYIYLPDDDEIVAGVYSGTGTPLHANLKMKQLIAGSNNFISITK
ncbi:MAG: hypothetical protein JEZ04_19435 [Spirochaetales bacterium]|nr:hypothetical protein [Spirochaetales bacterium]